MHYALLVASTPVCKILPWALSYGAHPYSSTWYMYSVHNYGKRYAYCSILSSAAPARCDIRQSFTCPSPPITHHHTDTPHHCRSSETRSILILSFLFLQHISFVKIIFCSTESSPSHLDCITSWHQSFRKDQISNDSWYVVRCTFGLLRLLCQISLIHGLIIPSQICDFSLPRFSGQEA